MEDRRSIALLVALTGILLGIGWYWKSNAPRIEMGPYQALGEIAAEEVSKLIGHRGTITLVVEDTSEGKDAVLETQLAAFQVALKRSGQATVNRVESIRLDPMARMAGGGAVPHDQLRRIAQQAPTPGALVLFMPCPPLGPDDVVALRQVKVRLVVLSAHIPGYKEMLRNGAIDLAILPKPTSADEPNGPIPVTVRQWFDREYRLVTPDQADSLAY